MRRSRVSQHHPNGVAPLTTSQQPASSRPALCAAAASNMRGPDPHPINPATRRVSLVFDVHCSPEAARVDVNMPCDPRHIGTFTTLNMFHVGSLPFDQLPSWRMAKKYWKQVRPHPSLIHPFPRGRQLARPA
jgi:hypothetical protein